ncbi:MAG: hypothetical protein KDB72_08940 [Mycobacterium sp.]|nr:hypothetical protein [Mycobacterium sp.]
MVTRLRAAGNTERTSPGLVDFLKLLFSKAVPVWLAAAFVLTAIPAHPIWLTERRHTESTLSTKHFPGIFQMVGYRAGVTNTKAFAVLQPLSCHLDGIGTT